MTQENKELLLKNLCARLQYGVKVKIKHHDDAWELLAIYTNGTTYAARDTGYPTETYFEDCKPYLFPLSSMTEEQKHELKMSTCPNGTGYFNEYSLCCPVNHFGEEIPFGFMSSIIDYLNKNHFDYHGLIEKGLAIDASELNIY